MLSVASGCGSDFLVRDQDDGPVDPDREHVLVGRDGGVGALVAQPGAVRPIPARIGWPRVGMASHDAG